MTAQRGTFVTPTAAGVGTTAQQARLSQAGLLAPSGDLGARPGVLSGLVVTGTTGWYYNVSAGHAVTTRGATDGAAMPTVDGTTATPTVTAAPPSGSRYDLIWIRQNDVDAGDANNNGVLGVTSGAALGSPSKPYGSVPTGAVVLAEALVATGASNTADPLVTLTDVRPWTATRDGAIRVRSKAERDALSAYDGLRVYRLDTHRYETYNGTEWQGELARFRGTLGTAVAVTGGVAMAFTVVEDTASAWATNVWVAPVTGTYLVTCMIRNGAAGITNQQIILDDGGGTARATSPNFTTAAFGGNQLSKYLRLTAGQMVRMYASTSYVTANDASNNNWLEIVQVSF